MATKPKVGQVWRYGLNQTLELIVAVRGKTAKCVVYSEVNGTAVYSRDSFHSSLYLNSSHCVLWKETPAPAVGQVWQHIMNGGLAVITRIQKDESQTLKIYVKFDNTPHEYKYPLNNCGYDDSFAIRYMFHSLGKEEGAVGTEDENSYRHVGWKNPPLKKKEKKMSKMKYSNLKLNVLSHSVILLKLNDLASLFGYQANSIAAEGSKIFFLKPGKLVGEKEINGESLAEMFKTEIEAGNQNVIDFAISSGILISGAFTVSE